MQHEPCELFTIIPKDEIDRVFRESETISAECDYTFLGFEKVYRGIRDFVPKDKIILDLGCGYAAQAFYFTDYVKYIGVDAGIDAHFATANMTFYRESIQEFIERMPERGISVTDCFAVCAYVPNKAAQQLVRETFPCCLVY